MSNKNVAFANEILRGLVGSTAHGTGIDGQEDRDEMGVFVEPKENVFGLTSIDHYIFRTAEEGQRSGPNDLDLTLYSLRKFTRLAASGNPSILLLLWLPSYLHQTTVGRMLVDIRQSFVSKEAGKKFLGYLVSQKMRLTGERSRNVSRPELVGQFGYDTKFAMHALRLGLQGQEFLETGNISVPVRQPDRALLLDVRYGRMNHDQAVATIERAEADLRSSVEACTIKADIARINHFLIEAHEAHWS